MKVEQMIFVRKFSILLVSTRPAEGQEQETTILETALSRNLINAVESEEGKGRVESIGLGPTP